MPIRTATACWWVSVANRFRAASARPWRWRGHWIADPPILLLDEPTAAMDHASEEALSAAARAAAGKTMIVVTIAIFAARSGRPHHREGRRPIVADGPKAQVVDALRQG